MRPRQLAVIVQYYQHTRGWTAREFPHLKYVAKYQGQLWTIYDDNTRRHLRALDPDDCERFVARNLWVEVLNVPATVFLGAVIRHPIFIYDGGIGRQTSVFNLQQCLRFVADGQWAEVQDPPDSVLLNASITLRRN